MKRPLALDLFCGGGGATVGLHRAGFDVEGVDIEPQPRYPTRRGISFVQRDALNIDSSYLRHFELIWASPICQSHTALRTMHNAKKHLDLIPQTRELLKRSGVPYIIENVVGAPLNTTCMLCGTHFGLGCDGADLRRHRIFETSFPVEQLQCQHRRDRDVIGVYGGHARNRRRRPLSQNRGVADFTIEQVQRAMEIDWLTLGEMSQAVPPAYSEYLARAAIASGVTTGVPHDH